MVNKEAKTVYRFDLWCKPGVPVGPGAKPHMTTMLRMKTR